MDLVLFVSAGDSMSKITWMKMARMLCCSCGNGVLTKLFSSVKMTIWRPHLSLFPFNDGQRLSPSLSKIWYFTNKPMRCVSVLSPRQDVINPYHTILPSHSLKMKLYLEKLKLFPYRIQTRQQKQFGCRRELTFDVVFEDISHIRIVCMVKRNR